MFLAMLLSMSVAVQAPVYQCKDADGNWSEQACPDSGDKAAQQEQQKASVAKARVNEANLERAWRAICESEEGGSSEACVRRQHSDYNYMTVMIQQGTYDKVQTAKLINCMSRWDNQAAGGVNATLWRYCYEH